MSVQLKNRFWIFAGASLALHALVLSELPRLSDALHPTPPPIAAQLLAPEPPPAPQPKPESTPALKKPVPRIAPLVPPAMRPIESPEPSLVSAPAPSAEVAEPAVTNPDPPSVAAGDVEPKWEPPVESTPPASGPATASVPTQPVRDLPQAGSIRYELFIGTNKLNIGRTVLTWEIAKGTYRLTSLSETTGLAGFLRPYQLDYVSEGRVDAAGLRPESFSVRRGRGGEQQYAARFNWANGEVVLGPANAPRKTALPNGTLDMLSFIYQLARAELAPGRLQLSITNGNKIDTYTLEVGAEEMIELPLGAIRTVPVRQIRTPGQESMEIWLAPERQYLPVRIRFLDRDGKMSGEQLAAEIATDVN